jgi:hypothetical protein
VTARRSLRLGALSLVPLAAAPRGLAAQDARGVDLVVGWRALRRRLGAIRELSGGQMILRVATARSVRTAA